MNIKELMERVGSQQTGRIIAYVKDGLEELEMLTETHARTQRINIVENQRFYEIPNEALRVIDIRGKNHLNSKDEYRSIPRMVHKPTVKDGDGI